MEIFRKQLLIMLPLVFALHTLYAQVKLTRIGENQFKNIPFAYSGTRVLMADRADDPRSENIFLMSKPERGSLPDTLFVQRYTKTSGQWALRHRETITHSGAISLVSNRKGYLIGDGQHLAAFFIYQLWDSTMEHKQSVHLLLLFRGKTYEISKPVGEASSLQEPTGWLSDDFAGLPAKVKQTAKDYWAKLD